MYDEYNVTYGNYLQIFYNNIRIVYLMFCANTIIIVRYDIIIIYYLYPREC